MAAEKMDYDECGRARCPECTSVRFHLRSPQGGQQPVVECMSCGTRLHFAPPQPASAVH